MTMKKTNKRAARASTPLFPPLPRGETPLTPPLVRGEEQGGQPVVSSTVVFVPSDCLGRGPTELGERLMGAFFQILPELEPKPTRIILINSGVKLAADGSPTLDDLRALAEQGVDILACGTCLSYFDLTKKLSVGRISNMYEIATALLEAERIVEL